MDSTVSLSMGITNCSFGEGQSHQDTSWKDAPSFSNAILNKQNSFRAPRTEALYTDASKPQLIKATVLAEWQAHTQLRDIRVCTDI